LGQTWFSPKRTHATPHEIDRATAGDTNNVGREMKKGLRHSLSLLVAAALTGFLLPAVWKLASDEWAVSGGGWFYDPWYQKDFLRAIVTLFVCDLLRQALLGRVMFVRLAVEIILVIAGLVNFRAPFLPAYVMFVVIGGSVIALLAAIIEEICAIIRLTENGSIRKEELTRASQRPD
jgi:hypothetical protein